jgi:CubicO group peptidase (beta-lactamase class C family)
MHLHRYLKAGLSIIFWMISLLILHSQNLARPADIWEERSAEELNIDPGPIESLHRAISSGDHGYVDQMLVVKNGYLVTNHRYKNDYPEISKGRSSAIGCGWECEDAAWMHEYNYLHPDYHPYPRGKRVHSLQSVTKSVSSILIGIAIDLGDIPGVDVPLLPFFDAYDMTNVDPRLGNATLDQLLTMQSGIEWHEQDRPIDETNTTLQLERSQDWIQFTLNQPMEADPGTKWVYNSGGSHLMSGIIKKATGMFIDEFAGSHLFEPLGIEEYYWKRTPSGYPDTEGGLFLRSEDLARIGLLYLRGGKWGERQIVSRDWVERSVAMQVKDVNQLGWGYGYQWWRLDRAGTEVWAGLGFGEQYLIVLPEYNTVGVINSWNLFGHRGSILGVFVDALIDMNR